MELLLVSHKGVASGIKTAAAMIVGDEASDIQVIELTAEDGIDAFTGQLEKYLTQWLGDGKKGLVLADLKGGTPYNRAEMLLSQHNFKEQAKVISGMNLPMVLDVLFQDIEEWSEEELQGIIATGRDGINCLDLAGQQDDGEDE